VKVYLPRQKKTLVFHLKGKKAVCDVLEAQEFFSVVGIIHVDGRYYFPKDGGKFLEAIYDYYFLKLIGISVS
jgi:hypothetical protein